MRLDDGRSVTIRPILPTDRNALKAFFESLTPATRRLRFLLPLRELPESLLRELTAVDQRSHVALVAVAEAGPARPPGEVVAEARYVRCAQADCAELAIVVAEGWRRHGLGSFLVRRLMRQGRLAGLRRLIGDALPDNQAIAALVRSLGGRALARAEDGDTVRLHLHLCGEPA
jgi:RimJ/RimL family protein N-acetyltransferase